MTYTPSNFKKYKKDELISMLVDIFNESDKSLEDQWFNVNGTMVQLTPDECKQLREGGVVYLHDSEYKLHTVELQTVTKMKEFMR